MNRLHLGLAIVALAIAAPPAPAGTRAWTSDDILAMRAVSDPRISPDGRWVVYVIQDLNDEKNDYQTDLWLAPADGGEARRLTTSTANDERPRWSPDGHAIAFLSERPRPGAKADDKADEGKRQVWMIRPDGGEAWPLTDAAGGVSDLGWSPKGDAIAFLSKEPKSEDRKRREKNKDDGYSEQQRLHACAQ